MNYEQMIEEIKQWLAEAVQLIQEKSQQQLTIQHKTGRTDLVTNIDREVQMLLIEKIQQHYPQDTILAEEENYSTVDTLQGNVWIIDPIDGTMNFVFEKENFCIMLAYYCEGIGNWGLFSM